MLGTTLATLALNLNLLTATPPDDGYEKTFNRMSGITRYIYDYLEPNYDAAGYVVFILVFILSAIVYKLGFAKELPLLKNIVIYAFLFFGCMVLTFLALFLPMIEGLIVAALILIIYKTRLWREKREARQANS